MIRPAHFFRALLVSATLCTGLAACQSAATNVLNSAVNSASFTRFTQIAQAAARVACSVTPTAASIAALVSSSPAVATASQAAAIACAALSVPQDAYSADNPAAAQRVEGVAVVDGKAVPVEGKVEQPKPADRTLAKKAPGATPENAR